MDDDGLELLRIDEVMVLFKIKGSKIRRAILRKEIPYIKLGGLIRFKKDDLKNYLEQQTVKSKETISNGEVS